MTEKTQTKTTAFFESSTPVLLSSSLAALGSNSSGTPQMDQLSYPFRKPLLIEEIRFTLKSSLVQTNLGALVYVRLSLGQMYLMRDPVPIASLGSFMSLQDEEYTGESYTGAAQSVSHYRWRLPYPLYVEAGQFILPVFSRTVTEPGGVSGATIDVSISYAGRTVPPRQPRPRIIPVPYVAPFVTALNPSGSYVQSNEKHLFNPFDKPVQMQRMTGRFYAYISGSSRVQLRTGITPGPLNASNLTVRLNDSWGGKMVNNFVGPSDVWDLQRMAWTYDTLMPAKGMYEAQVWNIPTSTSLHLAMIGTREEKL